MIIEPELIDTADGSKSLLHPLLGELYHSDKGAVGEAMHVYIDAGLKFVEGAKIRVLEVGFGSGLNAYLTMKNSTEREVDYCAVELFPVCLDVARNLNYSDDKEFMDLHLAPWGEKTAITKGFSLTKWEQDLLKINFFDKFDLVYFDAFAPDAQSELWGEGVFSKIADAMPSGAVLVTYCAKGVVKRALRASGFEVHRLQGALGKHHMLRAIKI